MIKCDECIWAECEEYGKVCPFYLRIEEKPEKEVEKLKGRWITHDDWHSNLRYGCNICGSLTKEKLPRCPTCRSEMEMEE